MKETPILFSGDLVRAVRTDRKTVTRRPVKWPVLSKSDGSKRRLFVESDVDEMNRLLSERRRHPHQKFSPFGVAGDRLWVRETWAACYLATDITDERYSLSVDPKEWKPAEPGTLDTAHLAYRSDSDEPITGPWRPSIHMPRWASRITLEVKSVRIERLQDISEEDAIAEGVNPAPAHGKWVERPRGDGGHWSARKAFCDLWDRIYAKQNLPWANNPWAWRVEFRRVA